MMARIRFVVGLAIVGLFASVTEAGMIVNHGAVRLRFDDQREDVTDRGDSVSASKAYSGFRLTQSGSASVAASADLIRLSFSGSENGGEGRGGAAGGAWQDIMFIDDSNVSLPSVVLRFIVEGSLSANYLSEDVNRVAKVVAGIDLVSNLQGEQIQAPDSGELSTAAYLFGDDNTIFRGWKSFTYDDGSFQGIYESIVRYDNQLGGYGFTVIAGIGVNLRHGFASGNFSNTFRLDGVFDDQGNAIDNVRFDSGLRLSGAVVPEPSSVVLAGLGMVTLAGVTAVRRRRGRAA